MKKKRINLLQNRYDYYALERLFRWLKRGVVIYSILLIFMMAAALGYYLMKAQEAEQIESQKKLLTLASDTHKTDEAKLLLLSKKLAYYRDFLKDDAQFVPYYNLLLEALQTSSQSGTLSEFNINKKHEVLFTIRFNSFDEMTQSFAFIESERFLNNFSDLSMANFFGLSTEQTKYELTFKGTFIDIK